MIAVPQVRDGFILFYIGDLKGVLQHDRLTLINADRPATVALATEVRRVAIASQSRSNHIAIAYQSHSNHT